MLKQLNLTIDWNPIKKNLGQFYHTGKQVEGQKAYPFLLLFKCLLLKKCFQIPSDPELESQINDRNRRRHHEKVNINASLTEAEFSKAKSISKKRYIVEQYFGESARSIMPTRCIIFRDVLRI